MWCSPPIAFFSCRSTGSARAPGHCADQSHNRATSRRVTTRLTHELQRLNDPRQEPRCVAPGCHEHNRLGSPGTRPQTHDHRHRHGRSHLPRSLQSTFSSNRINNRVVDEGSDVGVHALTQTSLGIGCVIGAWRRFSLCCCFPLSPPAAEQERFLGTDYRLCCHKVAGMTCLRLQQGLFKLIRDEAHVSRSL